MKKKDAEIVSRGISIIFDPKDKLYFHRCVIDCKNNSEGHDLVIVPWFTGFH
ncbi:MAG: hypothetical protein HOD92_02010 [Deltaproteobacteria bacterium]|nr:hypothetical protein [Deltaproteobacteria bacterium]MBT4526981.1 hypothetical protein [Deltaproteobacteria bacterium]